LGRKELLDLVSETISEKERRLLAGKPQTGWTLLHKENCIGRNGLIYDTISCERTTSKVV
jgi:hypothetical protein